MKLGPTTLIRDRSLNEAQTPGESEAPTSMQERLLDPPPPRAPTLKGRPWWHANPDCSTGWALSSQYLGHPQQC